MEAIQQTFPPVRDKINAKELEEKPLIIEKQPLTDSLIRCAAEILPTNPFPACEIYTLPVNEKLKVSLMVHQADRTSISRMHINSPTARPDL